MGLLDKLKRKKTTEKEPKAAKKETRPAKEIEKQAVVTPDGKLVSAPKKSATKVKKAKPKKEDTGQAYRVLIKPLITEKGSYLSGYSQYIFAVAPQTNKIEVRKAIKKVYGVDPVKVNIMNVSGKQIRYGRTEGRTKSWKKAIITLPPGQKIEIQEGL